VLAAYLQSVGQGGTVVTLTALDFYDLTKQLPIAPIEIPCDRRPLSFES
jgi:hypothetical protein